ncbi:hypothetical protein M409DRAFT_55242 [Zasmidium cellare ATCC 36951]|uniref:Cell wall galactomannoprotein n=1 Tax=Zasmidium cellare ATCC 36951 TaxID=1080233 RepID=A0A6A6CIS4_ZASCE|nr:uncharacterized protein M409DRAFT_55242 [Zasmidium cellare ATCC 36951]KAF2165862.1 hypothetical protein M409DRAFT_55242 [Zasmidium cellare ATCC 36951]
MKLSIGSICLIASTTITLVAADAAAVQTQIAVIGNYTSLLRSDVNNYNGSTPGLPWALQVQQDAVNLYRQIEQGTTLAKASGNFGEPGSFNVAAALLSITGTVKGTLSDTAAKAPTFDDLGPLVLGSLYQLKASTDGFGKAIVDNLAPIEKALAPAVQADLDNSFNSAITAYGGKPN